MKRVLKIEVFAGVLILLVASSIFIFRYVTRPIIPASIQKKVTSSIIIPAGDNSRIERTTVKYDSQTQVLSYVSDFNNSKITISEQAAPETFSDVPAFYSQWLSSLGEYASISTALDTIYLANAKSLGAYPVAIVATKGTLLFARPNTNLSQNTWRQFFDTMTVLKT